MAGYTKAEIEDFYPRSPCGERRAGKDPQDLIAKISIHALLAESDPRGCPVLSPRPYFYPRSPCGERLVTVGLLMCNLYFYPRSPCGERQHVTDLCSTPVQISIHALLAESDKCCGLFVRRSPYFYPRSPCGERLYVNMPCAFDIDFYPRSPCGERPRRVLKCDNRAIISIHALLAESDAICLTVQHPGIQFLSTLSLRRATLMWYQCNTVVKISIHALLAESDSKSAQNSRALLRI